MKTFIRVVEVWILDNSRTYLELSGGLYGAASEFAASGRQLKFSRGEGLPGQAWEQGKPVVLTEFEGSYFKRIADAQKVGLTGGIAIPVFAGEFLTSVLVFLCGDDEEHVGAIELWQAAPAKSPDMKMIEAYYGGTKKVFEFRSRHTAFRIGNGLPGLVWERGMPLFVEDLGKSHHFLRSDSAIRVGINRGVGIPCSTSSDDVCVMTFLSALGTPIARRFEIWVPDESREYLQRIDGFCETAGRLVNAMPPLLVQRGYGALGTALLTGVATVSSNAPAELGRFAGEAESVGLTTLAALPLIRDGRLHAVVVWYF